MAETIPRGIQATLFDYFQDTEYFDLQEANELLLEHQQRDINVESIRARIYEGIDKGLFERVGKGLYTVTRMDEQGRENTCLLINGDGRDLSMFQDNSLDAIITDHPYDTRKSLKGGNRNFADYELFQYNEKDFQEKLRVLKPGHFLVEFLPEENGDNYQYLYKVKDLARQAGFEYYAKVPWQKTGFVANTGRKSKNTEDILFFSKGRARELRPDAKKDKAEPGIQHYMSGAAGMLPTVFDVSPVKKGKIHQAEKPVELLQQILRFVTLPGETALDQFAGSGALGEAALKTQRNSVLIEKDEETFNKLRERIAALGQIETVAPDQVQLINIAIDALEASHDGPAGLKSFAEHQNATDRPLSEAFANLSALMYTPQTPEQAEQQEALAAAAKAIEATACQDLILQPSDLSPEVDDKSNAENLSSPEDLKVLECSSRGDRRFSALFAMVTIKGKEKSIEEWFQDSRRTADGKRAGKGKPFDHIICPFTGDKLPVKDAADLYRGLWVTYLSNNPDLVEFASQFDDFTNAFYDPDARQRQIAAYNANPLDETAAFFYRHSGLINPAEIIGAYVKGDRDRYVDVLKCSHWYQNMAGKLRKPSLNKQIQSAENKADAQSALSDDRAGQHSTLDNTR